MNQIAFNLPQQICNYSCSPLVKGGWGGQKATAKMITASILEIIINAIAKRCCKQIAFLEHDNDIFEKAIAN
jgi:hypothetical protein